VPNLAIFVSVVSVLSCGQTHRESETQMIAILMRVPSAMSNNNNNMCIYKVHSVSKQAESEAPGLNLRRNNN